MSEGRPHEQLGGGAPPPDITVTLLHWGQLTNKLPLAIIMGPSNRL